MGCRHREQGCGGYHRESVTRWLFLFAMALAPCCGQLEISGNPPLPYAYGGTNSATAAWIATSLTAPNLYGGSVAGSTLTINGTSNGSPSNGYVFLNSNGQNVMVGSATAAGDNFVVSGNAAAIAGIGGAHIVSSLIAPDNSSPLFVLYSFGTSVAPIIVGRNARGTGASPTATQTTDTLWQLLGQGWNGSGWVSSPQIVMSATEAWTGTANGSQTNFFTVKNGTAAQIVALTLNNDGQIIAPLLQNVTAATSGALCYTSSTGRVTYDNSTTCLVSSKRFKHSISPYRSNALEIVEQLRPVTFEYNQDLHQAAGVHIGLLAEDVAKLDPRLTVKDEQGQVNKINLQDLVTVLVKAVQEQQAEIEILQKRR